MKVYLALLLLAVPLFALHLVGLGWLIGLVMSLVLAAEVAVLLFYAAVFVRDVLETRRARRQRVLTTGRR